ncbi:MAG: hypothetical protein KAI66_17430, partial [Lentisphaeria bacterium]|nr:hypothetical protein [Lentisphaeria bacterium]
MNTSSLRATFIAVAFAVCALHAQEAKRPAADFAARALLRFDTLPVMNAVPHVPTSLAGRAVLAKGRFGQALDATKSEGMALTIPVPAQPEDELTLECWVKLMGDGKDRLQRIVGRSSNYGFYTNAKGGSLTWFVMAGEWKSCRGRLPLGEWCHIAGTFDGKIMRLYLNGKMVSERANSGSVERRSSAYFVGVEAGSDKNAFNGLIDEVRLSNTARTTFMTGIPLEAPKPTTTFRPADLGADAFVAKMTVLPAQASPKIDGDLGDAAWTPLPAAEFVTTKKATRPLSPTSIRVTRDAECLYLAYRCQEKGQETQRIGPAGQGNMGVFKHDGVEVLLQPGGSGTPYFQIAMNPAGGLVALKYAKAGTRAPWTSKGIRVSGVVHADYWTVEAAIPFADLQVEAPVAGSTWRANFCRNEQPSRELSAWSYTGGGFHVLKRFGTLTFAGGGEATGGQTASGRCELRGTVLDADGRPMSNVPVKTMIGLVRTDLLGTFRLRRLPQADIALEINTPVCQPMQGWVSLRKAQETLAPIRLTRIDPYVPAFATAPGTGPVTWLRSSIDEPPDMVMAPAADQVASQLELLATPGEYESRAVAFFARVDIAKPSVVVLGMKTESGAAIAASALRVRWTQRLLKRVHYTRSPEDAVWNWRFLWDEAPESVRKGHVRQLVLTVKVPTDARAGLYQGTLQLRAQGKNFASLPIRLRIAPFTLAKPAKIVGAYYGIRGLGDTQIARELDDIREHGGSVLIWHPSVRYTKDDEGRITPDFSSIRHAVELQKKGGLGPPYLIGTNPLTLARALGLKVEMTPEFGRLLLADESFATVYKDTVRKLDALEKEMGAGEFVYTWM